MQQRTSSIVKLSFVLALLLATLFSVSLLSAWTAPTATAPGGNTVPPINIGNLDQVKNGGLSLDALVVFGNALVAGSGGVSYVNFGSGAGSSGYGFRNNNGTMQFKNQNGEWKDICDCSTPQQAATQTWVAYADAYSASNFTFRGNVFFSNVSTDVTGPHTYGGNTFYVYNTTRKWSGTWSNFLANPQAAFDASVAVPVGHTPDTTRSVFNFARLDSYTPAQQASIAANITVNVPNNLTCATNDVNATQCHTNNHRVIPPSVSRTLGGGLFGPHGDSSSQWTYGAYTKQQTFQFE